MCTPSSLLMHPAVPLHLLLSQPVLEVPKTTRSRAVLQPTAVQKRAIPGGGGFAGLVTSPEPAGAGV